MHYKRFEEMPVWKDTRSFVADIYRFIYSTKQLKSDFSLSDQLKRASYSVLLNISEGFERGTKKDFANFISIAKGSAGEVRSILYIIRDSIESDKSLIDSLETKIISISAQLANFRKFLIKNN